RELPDQAPLGLDVAQHVARLVQAAARLERTLGGRWRERGDAAPDDVEPAEHQLGELGAREVHLVALAIQRPRQGREAHTLRQGDTLGDEQDTPAKTHSLLRAIAPGFMATSFFARRVARARGRLSIDARQNATSRGARVNPHARRCVVLDGYVPPPTSGVWTPPLS